MNEKATPIRAALYARFSSDNQREESIMAQFRDGEAYCRRHEYAIVAHYADEAKSGTTTVGRNQYKAMLRDAEKGKFDIVIFHKIDRNARNELDYYLTKHKLQAAGVRYAYSKQDIDSTTAEGQMMESVMVGMAAYYSRNLSNEIKKGLRENAFQGKCTGGRAPYGYMIAPDKKLIINEKEAPGVRMLFDLFIQGKRYLAIAAAMRDAGYLDRKGRVFKRAALYEMLRNPKYVGDLIIGRALRRAGRRNSHILDPNAQVYKDVIPAIISRDMFEEVQRVMDQNKHRTANSLNKHVYALSGLIYCGICGRPMAGHFSKNQKGKINYYYRCAGKQVPEDRCPSHMIRADELDDYIFKMICDIFLSPNAHQHIAELVKEKLDKEQDVDYKHELAVLQRCRQLEMDRLDRLYQLYMDGKSDDYTMEQMAKKKEDIDLLDQKIQDAKDHLQVGPVTYETIDRLIDKFQKSLKQKKSPELIQTLFRLTVQRVTVYEDHVVVNLVVSQERFELTTHRLEGGCSIQLSY